MYKQEFQYTVLAEIRDTLPLIRIGVRFNDYFTKDTYALVSEVNSKSTDLKNIPFAFYVNNEPKGKFVMENNDVVKLLSNVFDTVQDYDFQLEFVPEIKNHIQEQVLEALKDYKQQVLLNEVTIKGEVLRMREIAGMQRKYLT